MRSSASTSSPTSRSRSAASLAALALTALAGGGCAGPDLSRELNERKVEAALEAAETRKERLETLLPGRWTGDAVGAPAGVWFEKAKFDVTFSRNGDFAVVASTFARRPYPLRFEGEYEVLDGDQMRVEEANLGGIWRVTDASARGITIALDEMKITLKRRYGT